MADYEAMTACITGDLSDFYDRIRQTSEINGIERQFTGASTLLLRILRGTFYVKKAPRDTDAPFPCTLCGWM